MKINLEDVNYIKIVGKRWFQPTYGNTYHSTTIFITSGEGESFKTSVFAREPFEYGYDEQYMQTAAELLGVDYSALRELIRKHPEKFVVQVTDVKRKKDL